MALSEEQLELLSGYLDDALDASERETVEELLRTQPDAQRELDSLRANRSELAGLAPSAGLSADFTARVLADIARSDIDRAGTTAPQVTRSPTVDVAEDRKSARPWVLAVVAAAAVVLIAFVMNFGGDTSANQQLAANSPVDQDTAPGDGEDGSANGEGQSAIVASETPATEPVDSSASVRYVSQLQWRMSMALVLHVEPSAAALRENTLQLLLSDAGIATADPIAASEQLQAMLLDSEMIVTDESLGRSMVYYVRAEAASIDQALREVWDDGERFPKAYFNLSMDGPEAELMKQIAKSTGTRFEISQSFAAPVESFNDGAPGVPMLKSQEVLISKKARGGLPVGARVLGDGSQEMADLLIMVRLPQ